MEIRTILFVDDEESVLHSLKRGLMDEPYNLLFANSGKEALEILESEEVHVLVTDMRMPEMGGLELLRKVKEEYPYMIRLVLSGYAHIDIVLKAVNEGEIFRFIPKPWNLEEVKIILRQAIEFYDLYSERSMLLSVVEKLIEGNEPDQVNLQLIKKILSTRKNRQYQWEAETTTAGSEA